MIQDEVRRPGQTETAVRGPILLVKLRLDPGPAHLEEGQQATPVGGGQRGVGIAHEGPGSGLLQPCLAEPAQGPQEVAFRPPACETISIIISGLTAGIMKSKRNIFRMIGCRNPVAGTGLT